MKNIVVAEEQGFCWGVRRALEIVNKFDEVLILGDLIHNKQVVDELEKNNKKVIKNVTGDEKVPVVITAHGTSIDNIRLMEGHQLEIVDTTCPLVSSIYRAGEKLEAEGYQILILGDADHVEVKGIASRMINPIIINSESDIEQLELPERLGVISQSTFSVKKFDKIVEKLKTVVKDVKVRKTICSPTKNRQAAAEKLAKKVEVMVVIGGYHSSNTKKLVELTRKYVESYHIETADQLDEKWFLGKTEIGITAGASTADWVIKDVYDTIMKFT